MIDPIVPDTDVLIDYFRGHPSAIAFLNAHGDRIILSPIVVAELYAGTRSDPEIAILDRFIAGFPVVPLTVDTARMAGKYCRQYAKSHNVELPDALVAALAQTAGAELQTLNVKHFPMFPGLKPPYRKP